MIILGPSMPDFDCRERGRGSVWSRDRDREFGYRLANDSKMIFWFHPAKFVVIATTEEVFMGAFA